jgi:CBS domain-containing protein
MSTHRISGLPVVDEEGRLSGIVSKTDMTQAVAHGVALDRVVGDNAYLTSVQHGTER